MRAITPQDLAWIEPLYDSPEFAQARQRYIEIYRQLPHIQAPEQRRPLISEAGALLKAFL
jgi:hypothetical protein